MKNTKNRRKTSLIKLRDAVKAIADLPDSCNGFSGTYDKASIIDALEGVPTADAEPVIRCKDCEYFRPFSDGWNGCYNYAISVSPDHFCSSAERRTDDN